MNNPLHIASCSFGKDSPSVIEEIVELGRAVERTMPYQYEVMVVNDSKIEI